MLATPTAPPLVQTLNQPATNSREALQARAQSGLLTWKGPLVMLAARTVLIIAAQAAVFLFFMAMRSPNAMKASSAWWQVTGTFVDMGCLALLFWLTRREGIRLWDLIALNRKKLGRDVLLGLGILVVMFPIVMIGGSMLSGLVIYGAIQPVLPAEVMSKALPWWAALYARSIWWLVWSATEEMTYNGYTLPRLQILTGGRTWLAVLIVGIFWAVQHSFLPFIPDGRVFLYLFVQMLPLVVAMQLLYLRFRRLPPTIIMHWGMDLISTIMMISVT